VREMKRSHALLVAVRSVRLATTAIVRPRKGERVPIAYYFTCSLRAYRYAVHAAIT
jgi:hypothetical protein